ncbi:AGAP008640-PA-like protein [Anopheles sinensis]|uniref:AGAP008640-PA-like protein n=1 Tax=Anopheles sinensis TaxID=74873 RepID=A0A084W7P2_ANOSI|nr:AGAP008640-PA-like protein [Anopheles sinensis]
MVKIRSRRAEESDPNALRCWRCSSDASTAAFCDDPFTQEIVNEQQRKWSYVECNHPPQASYPFNQQNQQTRAVCKKMKQVINDRVVVSRSCSFEDINAPPNACTNAQTPSYIKTEFCETCLTDGCNGASQYGPAALLVVVTAFLAKLLAW